MCSFHPKQESIRILGRPGRVSVIGSAISVCDTNGALDILDYKCREGSGGYICFTNAHAAVMGHRDAGFQQITNESLLSLADGKPVFWAGRMKGAHALGHVPGPDFMMAALGRFAKRRHFFYGSTPDVLERLVYSLREQIPDVNVVGTCSPPFRSLTSDELAEHCAIIRATGAEFVWVGLGAPKQERWMATEWEELRPAILLGVGAAFDFGAGVVRRAPRNVRAIGLEWLHRLLQEPTRLWRRYLVTNSLFVWYLTIEWLGSIGSRHHGAGDN